MFKHPGLFALVVYLSCFTVFSGDELAAQVKPDVIKKIEEALPKSAPAKAKKARKVLIFSKTNGFRHGSIAVGAKSLTMLGEKTGAYTAVHSEDDSMFEADKLKEFDAVIMLNTTGELFRPRRLPKDAEKKKAALEREERLKKNLVDFVKSGKGLAGTHSGTDTYKNWKEYGLAEIPNVGDNAVHASASPFEALCERMNWLG